MPIVLRIFVIFVLIASVGCTTRADKGNNKDYDKPKSSAR
jgi:hypothetical protein